MKTEFMIRDQGDSSVGIQPTELSLTVNYEVDPDDYEYWLKFLRQICADLDWHGIRSELILKYQTSNSATVVLSRYQT